MTHFTIDTKILLTIISIVALIVSKDTISGIVSLWIAYGVYKLFQD